MKTSSIAYFGQKDDSAYLENSRSHLYIDIIRFFDFLKKKNFKNQKLMKK